MLYNNKYQLQLNLLITMQAIESSAPQCLADQGLC